MHAVHATVRQACRDCRIEGRHGLAKTNFLAFHVAQRRINTQFCQDRIALCFRPVDDGHTGDQKNGHRRDQRPALPAITDHLAEGVDQRGRDRQHGEDVEIVRPGRRVLKWMRSIHIEEAAAIRAELLDRLLRRDRAKRDHLLGAVQRRCRHRSLQRLRQTHGDEGQCNDDGKR